MANKAQERPMTDEEREMLSQRASGFKYNIEGLKELGGYTISIVPTLTFILVLVWLLIAWFVRAVFEFDFGWNSPYGLTVFWSLAFLSFGYTIISLIRSESLKPQVRQKLIEDIKNGKILVEEHCLTEGKVFEEPEHGGLIYFFRTAEERVFVSFDSESQDLAISGEEAGMSSFVPRNKLRLEKTPIARAWVKEEYFGDELTVPKPLVFTADTNLWPEDSEFINISWSDIESKYAG